MPYGRAAGNFIKIIEQNLSTHESVQTILAYIRTFPEIYSLYCAELNAGLSLFSRFQFLPHEFPEETDLLINAKHLRSILNARSLPDLETLEHDIELYNRNKQLWKSIFVELSKFDFLNERYSRNRLSGAFFVAFYRTYTLNRFPDIREKGGQVASTVEEMLAILAISGCKTQLFLSTQHWLLDYQNEGFSEALFKRLEGI